MINRSSKNLIVFLVLTMAISSLSPWIVRPANAQKISTSSSPAFTFKFADNSYFVPPTNTSTIDPYTGKVTITTTQGYYVQNKTIEAVISNNLGAYYYNFRYKGHYTNEWSYYPSDPNSVSGYNHYDAYSVPCQTDSTSQYTTIALNFLPNSIPANGTLDVQIQALFGGYRAVPYGHAVPLPAPTYDFYFNGTVSNWSNTQTLLYNGTDFIANNTTPTQSPFPSPTVPEFPTTAILTLLLLVFSVAVVVKHRKTANLSK